jgi:hypothetical protein
MLSALDYLPGLRGVEAETGARRLTDLPADTFRLVLPPQLAQQPVEAE